MARIRNVEPVAIYQDITWVSYTDDVVHHFDDKYVSLFDGKLGNAVGTTKMPKGWSFLAEKLVIYSQDFEQRPTMQAADRTVPAFAAPQQDISLRGWTVNEADTEITFTLLHNGAITQGGGGATKIVITPASGIIMIPFYEIRLINLFQTEAIDFRYLFDEMDTLILVARRTSSDNTGIWWNYAIKMTLKLIGKLIAKNCDRYQEIIEHHGRI